MIRKNRDPLHAFLRSISARSGVIPPFALELVLVDGMYYYVHSIEDAVEDSISISVRIWDTRRLDEGDLAQLRQKTAELDDPSRLVDPKSLHPDLDWGVLRIDIDQISYCVEWHHMLWPVEGKRSMHSRLH
jgi:hypothetical protein